MISRLLFTATFILFFTIIAKKYVGGDDETENVRLKKINFNLRFKCGPYYEASGRLSVRFRKTENSGYQQLLDVVLTEKDKGIFQKTVFVPFYFPPYTAGFSFEIRFRTDCYVLNRIGECCAHEFTFIAPIQLGGAKSIEPDLWIATGDYNREESGHRQCCKVDKDRGGLENIEKFNHCCTRHNNIGVRHGTNCGFDLRTQNPLKGYHSGTIDLLDLLLKTDNFLNKFKFDSKPIFKSVRICSPRDDESDEPWSKESPLKICAHPHYGLMEASFEREMRSRQKNQEGMKKEWRGQCECNARNNTLGRGSYYAGCTDLN